jgi:hypothetical protein
MLAVQYVGKVLSSIFGSKIKYTADFKVYFSGGFNTQEKRPFMPLQTFSLQVKMF